MANYATLTEKNDHEGETWRHYIPVAGNEAAITQLARLIEADKETSFSLRIEPVNEEGVDARVALGDGDYMAAHTKLSGRLVVPESDGSEYWLSDLLYKGGIAQLMEADE